MDDLYYALEEIFGQENVSRDEPMSRHVTFKTGGPADAYVQADEGSLAEFVRYAADKDIPYMVIGHGSNLLVGDKGIRGVVIEIGRRMADITVSGDVIESGAGVLLSAIAAKAANADLAGFEFAAGIPGSLGGAVVMNAGAYGGELKDVLLYADVLTLSGEKLRIPARELELSYRHSVIPEKGYLVISAGIKLCPGDKDQIQARMNELKEKRMSKQPLEYPSAGSTFKRPEGYFAGKLIEDSGLKGFSVGGAQVSEKHCGFIINKSGATSADIRNLIEQVKTIVHEKQGVWLEEEVRSAGEF